MKFNRRRTLAVLAGLSVAIAACGGSSDDTKTNASGATGESGTSSGGAPGGGTIDFAVANIVNGYLGDQGFFDDAESGIQELAKEGYTTKTLQADPNNTAQWKANLESVSTGDYNIVIVGSTQMNDLVVEATAKYPDQKFISYDVVIDSPAVASIVYKQNEGSFLAGVLAALATTDTESFPMANADKKVGLVGGTDIPVINDFVVGYKAGVAAVDPDIEVLVSYVGNFTDSQKGYDQAKAMYDQGADVVFQVAGGAGLGVLKAAQDSKRYGIGVDSNQNALQPGFVLASMLKNVGVSLVQAVHAAKDGTLKYGETEAYGLSNDGVGLDFENNNDLVPQSVIDQIDGYKQQVIDGKIEVPSVTG